MGIHGRAFLLNIVGRTLMLGGINGRGSLHATAEGSIETWPQSTTGSSYIETLLPVLGASNEAV
jgi:hypothetical protein